MSDTFGRVVQMETLEGIQALRFLPNHIQERVDELDTLGVVSLTNLLPVPVCLNIM